MPIVRVFAMSTSTSNKWDQFKQRVEERRTALETARGANVKRLQTHVQRMVKKELDFVASVWDEIVPVKATWDEEAWKRIQDALPVRIQPKKTDL